MMNSTKFLLAMLLVVACMCGSCSSNSDEPNISAYNVPMRKLTVNLHVNTEQSHEGSQSTRLKAPNGDPGLRVDLVKPSVLYVVVWCRPTHPSLGGKAYMQAFKMPAPDWSESYSTDVLGNEGLWLEGSAEINIPRSITAGRVMICASATDLGETSAWGSWPAATGDTFKGEPYEEEMDIPEDMLAKGAYESSCEAVKDITFDLPDVGAENYSGILGSIFSNAYDDASNGDLAGRDRCDIVLYHTAAMLDMTWNVNPTAQEQSKVGPITVKNLRSTGIHPFAPASASHQPTTTGNYNVTLTPSVGQQWAGREYIYVAQYGGTNFPLVYDIKNNKSGTTHSNQSVSLPLPSNVYTSWMRYNLRLNY